ncbi:MAG: 6-pyruvoyl tetrahydropterin synthase family protein [Candidatus Thorarchaeota archaeon]
MGFKVVINANRIKFSACHFLKEPLKCSRLHGHNYYVSVEISSDLDENYFVVDFIELKKNVKSIVKPLDHSILIPKNSTYLTIKEENDSVEILTNNKKYVFPRSEIVYLPLSATTSELLAKYIHDNLKKVYLNKKIKVKVEESKNNIAIYED